MKNTINLINLQINNKNKKKLQNLNYRDTFLLGEWCELKNNFYKDDKKFKSLNFYDWNNLKKKTQDTKTIIRAYDFFLNYLYKKMNTIHGKNYNQKFWEIILSRWLFSYIVNLFSRWEIANKVTKKYKIKNLYTYNLDDISFVPDTSQHSHWIMQSPKTDLWNVRTFNNIFRFLLKDKINKKNIQFNKSKKNIFVSQKKIFSSKVISFYKKKKIFFYNLSLYKKYKILLMAQNKFLNLFLKKKEVQLGEKISLKKRELLIDRNKKYKNEFYNFIISDLKYSLPKIFLEYYPVLEREYENLNWPKNPDYILTSYGQYYDEVFKIYCAKNIKKSKFFILQHGYNNIFADGDFYSGNLDKKISHKFLTWGKNFKDNSKSFIFPYRSYTSKKINLNKKILLILYAFNEQPHYPLNGFINGNQKNMQTVNLVEKFVSNLKIKIQKNCSAKLLSHSMVNSVNNSIKFKFPKLQFVDSKKKYSEVINSFNVSIHFFLGTPFFESMHHNKPCILIFNKEMHLNFDKKFSSILNELIKHNICFEDVDKASKFLNSYEDNILKWWNKKEVIKLKKKFCEIYCQKFDNQKNIFQNIF